MQNINTKRKRPISDCLPCIVRPFLRIGYFTGVTCVRANCPHATPAKNLARFETPKFALLVSFLVVLLNFAYCVYLLVFVLGAGGGKRETLEWIVDLIVNLCSVNFSFFSLLKTRVKIEELYGLSAIIENRFSYGVSSFFPIGTTKLYKTRLRALIWFIMVSTAICFYFTATERKHKVLYVIVLRTLFVNVSYYAQTIFVFGTMFSSIVYETFYKACYQRIETLLRRKLDAMAEKKIYGNVKSVSSYVVGDQEESLEVALRKLNRLYFAITENYKHMVMFLFPAFTIGWLCVVALLIINFYFLVMNFWNSTENAFGVVMQSYGCFVSISILLVVVQRVQCAVRCLFWMRLGFRLGLFSNVVVACRAEKIMVRSGRVWLCPVRITCRQIWSYLITYGGIWTDLDRCCYIERPFLLKCVQIYLVLKN